MAAKLSAGPPRADTFGPAATRGEDWASQGQPKGKAEIPVVLYGASLVAQLVRNLPAMQETWVGSLGQEDPLEKGMATHSRILAWETARTEPRNPTGSCSVSASRGARLRFSGLKDYQA